MTLHGVYHLGNDRVACRNLFCTTCHQPRLAEGRRSLVILHLCFVPFAPIGMTTRWFCRTCKKETDAKRPSRKGVLVAGVLFGIFMTFIGVLELVKGGDTQTIAGGLIIGPVVAVGLIMMIRKQDYAGYVTAKATVVPLSGDHCPLCREPVFASTTPRCHKCAINLVTN